MGSVGSTQNTMMSAMLMRAQQFSGMALINLLDVTRKAEMTLAKPLGNFSIGGMIDTYA